MEGAGRGWDWGGAGRLSSIVAAVCILKVYAIVTHSLKLVLDLLSTKISHLRFLYTKIQLTCMRLATNKQI